MNTNLLLQQYNNLKIPQNVKDLLVGCILGDATIKINRASARFVFRQGAVHKEYIYFLFSILSTYAVSSTPIHSKYVDSRTNKQGESYYFVLKSSPHFLVFAELFYKPINKDKSYVKYIPWHSIYSLLTPRALAYWIMDDGQYVARGGLTLCTDNFCFQEVFSLMLVLEMKLGLVCSIHTKNYSNRTKLYYRIYISGKSLFQLRSLVSEHMHSSIRYKLKK